MASGTKQILIPTSQRILSSDLNRAQKVMSADLVELLNHLLLAATIDDDESGGLVTFSTTTGTPLGGIIVKGLTFQPQIASANANVSQGILVVVDPDGSPDPDDSPVKYIRVAASNTLTLTPNSSGQTRIDIVEVQRANTVTETQTVDIFNTTTGVFAPASVNKAIQSTLNYRIRTGANGGGLPSLQSGWMPIAVCSVPNGAVNWDACAIWDVRPLLEDRATNLMNASRNMPVLQRQPFYLSTANTTNGTKLVAQGYTEGVLGAWRIGGSFIDNGATDQINLQSNTYLEPGTAYSANAPYAVYLTFPANLPRWVRYTPAAVGVRKPRGPRGFPVLSTKIPQTANGAPSAPLTMPAADGLGGTIQPAQAVCVAFGFDTVIAGKPDNVTSDGRMQYCASHGNTIAGSNVVAGTVNFSLIPGTHFPGNAKRLRVRFTLQATWSNGLSQLSVQTYDDSPSGGSFQTATDVLVGDGVPKDPSGGNTYQVECEVPVQATFPSNLAPTNHRVAVTFGGSATGLTLGAAANHTIQVIGWDLTP